MLNIDLSIIAPCYNEEHNIPEFVNRLIKTVKKIGLRAEIILINDGSTDNTENIIHSLVNLHHGVVFGLNNKKNLGIEESWRNGLEECSGRNVCIIDSDLQYQPEAIERLYRELQYSNADVVQGYRSSIGRLEDSRKILSKVLNFLLNTIFKMNLNDNKSGFIICSKPIFESILNHRFNYNYFQSLIMVAAHSKGYRIRQVETLFLSRQLGDSFIPSFPFRLIINVLTDLFLGVIEYRFSPIKQTVLRQILDNSTLNSENIYKMKGLRKFWFRVYILFMPIHHWMIGRSVATYYNELNKSQWLPSTKIKELQDKKLNLLVQHSYKHVPYYREKMDSMNLSPDDIQSIDDLHKLPLLSKKDVKENIYFDLMSDNHDKSKIQKITTSGSTGQPFTYYVDKQQLEFRWAATLRGMEMTNYKFGDKQARLWHQTLGLSRIQIIKEYMDAFFTRRKFFPVFEIKQKNIDKMIKKLSKYKPTLIDGYAEAINLCARYISSKEKLSNKKMSVISSAQMLPQHSRELIENNLNCKVYDKYGSREFSGIAYECNKHFGHHVVAENYVVEILKDKEPAKENEVGEIVITDLNNYCMPLIRYRIGDLAKSLGTKTCDCGRGLPLIGDIQGRVQSIIVGANGKYLPGTYFSHLFKDFEFIVKQYQVIQTKVDEIDIKIVKALRFEETLFNKLIDSISNTLGNQTKINISFEKNIPLIKTGKQTTVLSKIPIDFQNISNNIK